MNGASRSSHHSWPHTVGGGAPPAGFSPSLLPSSSGATAAASAAAAASSSSSGADGRGAAAARRATRSSAGGSQKESATSGAVITTSSRYAHPQPTDDATAAPYTKPSAVPVGIAVKKTPSHSVFAPGGAKSSTYGGTMHWKAASPTPESARAKRKK